MHNFRELKIWKVALDITKQVYSVSAQLPVEERFGLQSQINRSAVSIPSNIAEGSGRNTNKDFRKFISIALSSSYELETQLMLIEDIFEVEVKEIIGNLNELQKMMAGFKKTIG